MTLAEKCQECVYADPNHRRCKEYGDVDLWFAQRCNHLKKTKTAELKEKGYVSSPWSDFAARKEMNA